MEREGQWLDLPNDVTEKILERLPLPDYIRLAAVCTHWLSVQRHHRLRYSPLPPPKLRSLPWFIDTIRQQGQEIAITCISPWEGKSHCLKFPGCVRGRILLNSSTHGWLVTTSWTTSSTRFSIFNPISKVSISLPPIKLPGVWSPILVAPPPCSLVFVMSFLELCLFKLDDRDQGAWAQLPLPKVAISAVIHGCMLYYVSSELDFFVVDTEGPAVQLLHMDRSELQGVDRHEYKILAESDAEILLVVIDVCDKMKKGVRLFRADVCRRKWVKVGSIGKRALVVKGANGVSLVAEEDHENWRGVRGNCVYFFQPPWKKKPGRWREFDLSSGVCSYIYYLTPVGHSMFVPTLC